MILTGTELICIVPASDTHFAESIWLEQLPGEGEFIQSSSGIELLDSNFYNTARDHSYTFQTADHQHFIKLATWESGNTPLNIYSFGVDGVIFFRESVVIRTELKKPNQSKNISTLEVSCQLQKSTKLIYQRKNLLDTDIANANLTSQWSVSGGTITLINPGHASFTLKDGNILKLVQSAHATPEVATSTFKIPVRLGMSFHLRLESYTYNGGSNPTYLFGLSGRNSSGTEVEYFEYESNSNGNNSMSFSMTIGSANTKYVVMLISVDGDGSAATMEFDKLIVSYKNQENWIDG